MNTTTTKPETCFMPVNHNGTHLAREPMTLVAAKAELAEYTYQTENEGEIIIVATLRPVSFDELDARTTAARYDDPRVARWGGHTQTWAFDNGDAIVVVGNYPECWIVVRVGDTVKVCDASSGGGVVKAMAHYFGIEAAV